MKLVEIVAPSGHDDTLRSIAEQERALDCWVGAEGEDGRRLTRMVAAPNRVQGLLDALQSALGGEARARITVHALEVSLPRAEEDKPDEAERRRSAAASREGLYDAVEKSARLDRNFVVLVVLSTVVAAIGLIEDNVAVVIGAMVIAPLLGPNLALALGTALGDRHVMMHAVTTNLAGLAIVIGMTIALGALWPLALDSRELLARTDVGLDSIALALASGAAAVLSITTGLPSVLVGVMVAVALLPPAATLGIMLGAAQFDHALGAGLLLAVNIVSVNLAAKLVFLIQGIRPRTWIEKRAARQSMAIYIAIWLASLAVLVGAIYLRGVAGTP